MRSGCSNGSRAIVTRWSRASRSARPAGAGAFSVRSNVWFRALTREEIVYYVDNFHPLDKAGSYGIQEWIGYAAIERIDGSFFNVMGLPIQRVYTELNQFIQSIKNNP